LVLADTGAAVLCLTVSFDFFEIGGHGGKSGGLAPLREQYSRKALLSRPVAKLYKATA
jgi:hypothetical protein